MSRPQVRAITGQGFQDYQLPGTQGEMELFNLPLSCSKAFAKNLNYPFSLANVSESTEDRAADPEWHKRRPSLLPLHNRCRTGIASTAFDGIQSRLDEYRQKALEGKDRRGLNREK